MCAQRGEQTKTASAAPGRCHDPQRKDVASVHGVVRVAKALAGHLCNVDQSLYTVRNAGERSERHHPRDSRVDGLTGLKLADVGSTPLC